MSLRLNPLRHGRGTCVMQTRRPPRRPRRSRGTRPGPADASPTRLPLPPAAGPSARSAAGGCMASGWGRGTRIWTSHERSACPWPTSAAAAAVAAVAAAAAAVLASLAAAAVAVVVVVCGNFWIPRQVSTNSRILAHAPTCIFICRAHWHTGVFVYHVLSGVLHI